MIKNNFFLFNPIYLLYKKHSVLFYREHIDFFLALFKFTLNNKNLYFIYKNAFISIIIKKIYNYIINNSMKKEINLYLKKILNTIIIFREKKNFDLYSYLLNFCGLMLFLSYYNVAIFTLSTIKNDEKKNINNILSFFVKKYEMQPKLVICFEDQKLKKGIALYYQNNVVNVSLKKIYELFNNRIDRNDSGNLI